MTVYYVIAILTGIAGLITPLTLLYGKLVKPIKKVMQDTEDNKREVETLKSDIKKLECDIKERDEQAAENRALTIKSLLTLVDTLQEHGLNGESHDLKKELVNHVSKRASKTGKK